ncbi:MAG: hypothetical protein J6U21_10615 [Bacteroidales bacterium]|nr:hypothetical protein [Bacteroidales bacterium]
MSELFSDYNVCQGDEIVITKVDNNSGTKRYINVKKYDRVVLKKDANGVEIINIERLNDYLVGEKEYTIEVNNVGTIKIAFNVARKKRSDSPNETDFYNVTIDRLPTLENGTYYLNIGGTPTFSKALPKYDWKNVEISSRQQIFYGAPGTGKSHTIKQVVEDIHLPHIRTTFHPDSDYSTFVGAYKPTSIDVPMRNGSGQIIEEDDKEVIEKKIIYTFVPQAFLKAYVAAWKNQGFPFFLIIEEINRGNCAQIFGDLFQLLDRNSEGVSEYPITPDDDIRKHLKGIFSTLDQSLQDSIPDVIRSGRIMRLPQNLYIWATMNTSDQSLFPIDSAFKRRWDWKYTPIANGNKNWKIKADGKEYDWWQFLEEINKQIYDAIHSEDKKLGYYFCKPINGQTIDAETFVSKVVFYLWNDVFKDYVEDASSIFKDDDDEPLFFNKFYTIDANGKAIVVEQKITRFMQNIKVAPLKDVKE